MKGNAFSERLGEALVNRGLLTLAQVEEANLQMERAGTTLEDALFHLRMLEEHEILTQLADVSGVLFAEDLSGLVGERPEGRRVPIQYARRHFLYPFVDARSGENRVAVNQLDHEVLENVSAFLGEAVNPILSTRKAILEAINLTYERSSDSADMVIENLDNGDLAIHAGDLDEPQDLLDSSDEAPIINFVNSLLYEAVRHRASDIHIEPFEGDLSVRYRVDGVLHNVHSLPEAPFLHNFTGQGHG